MIRYLLPRILLPLLALLLLEALFRGDLWERMTAPDSHAGTSIRLKQALAAESRPIQFVTLGSSRAVYGLDHARIAALAAKHQSVQANLSMPGAHWMTIMTVIDWLKIQRPEVQGGVIALSITDMQNVGNGNYELAIVRPFQGMLGNLGDAANRFEWHDPSSYGSVSALFQYRGDIQNALRHPLDRLRTVSWFSQFGQHKLFDGPRQAVDACDMPWDNLAHCAAYAGDDDAKRTIANQCRGFANAAGQGGDWRGFASGDLPPILQDLLDLRQKQLRSIGWTKPPIVILMPTTHHWKKELAPLGAREWAHRILDPLAQEGSIKLLDYTDFFDRDGQTRCDVFWDLYHQNQKGITELTDALLPELERALYD